MIKYSRQRECILQNLQSRSDHPTADMVYESVRKEQPNISLGTVYRNLAFLAESGQILKLSTGAGPDHFDGCIKPHIHFFCRSCGNIFDLGYIPEEKIVEHAAADFDGQIEGYDLQLFGRCRNCRSNNN